MREEEGCYIPHTLDVYRLTHCREVDIKLSKTLAVHASYDERGKFLRAYYYKVESGVICDAREIG